MPVILKISSLIISRLLKQNMANCNKSLFLGCLLGTPGCKHPINFTNSLARPIVL